MPRSRLSRKVILIGITTMLLVLYACTSGGSSEETLMVNGVALTEAEFKFGTNVEPHPDTTYQDDVVLIPNGAQAVRHVTADGVTWTVDRQARGMSDLEVGKVMFITSLGVGRVVHLAEDGNDLVIQMVPVDLTDIFWEAEFGGDFEFNFDEMIVDDHGEQAWTLADLPSLIESETDTSGAQVPMLVPVQAPTRASEAVSEDWLEGPDGDGHGEPDDAGPNPFLPEMIELRNRLKDPNWGNAPKSDAGPFAVIPITPTNGGGIGVNWQYHVGDKEIEGGMRVMASAPRASFQIKIAGGSIETATMRIDGNFNLAYSLFLKSNLGNAGNFSRRVEVPGRIRIPMPPIGGVSTNFTVSQSFLVRTAISAKPTYLLAKGSYNLDAGFSFGYQGSVQPSGPRGGTIQTSLMNEIRGQSLGVSGIVLGHRAEFRIGIGWGGFSVGPFVDVTSSVGVVRGSDLASPLPVCQLAFLNLWAGAGLSYRLPEILVDVVNFVLRVFDTEPVAAEGNIARVTTSLLAKESRYPNAKVCRAD